MAASVRYRIVHETRYRYSETVLSSHHLAHLEPRNTHWQSVVSHFVDVEPQPRERFTGSDFFGNGVLRFFVDQAHDALVVRAESIVDVAGYAPGAGSWSPDWKVATMPDPAASAEENLELEQYRAASPMVPKLDGCADYARESFAPERPWLDAVTDLTRRIRADFTYDPEATTVTTQVAEVLARREGVCQDFAHLMISCLRSLGLPARYVSGYVLTQAMAGQARLTGADASHAWVATHCPAVGWLAFDPTNGKLADREFVTLGWGREFADVTPLRGVVLGSATQVLEVAVDVVPMAIGLPASITG